MCTLERIGNARVRRTSLVLVVIAGLVVGLSGWGPAASAAPPRPPKASFSYYVHRPALARHHANGCSLGRRVARGDAPKDLLVVMAFGRPMHRGRSHGASLFRGFHPTWELRQIGMAYARGYVECSPGVEDAHLRIALGTSNFGPGVTYWHGRAWAEMVNLADELAVEQGLGERVDFAGANDIEPGWSRPKVARRWVRGYDAAHRSPFYNFGGAAGCPPYGDCQGNWTQEDIWFVSTGADAALPLPEIYTASGASAEQWYRLSLWAHHNRGEPLDIQGVMSQRQACLDERDPCRGLKIWPARSFRMLWHRLRRDPRTRGSLEHLRYVTNIRWDN